MDDERTPKVPNGVDRYSSGTNQAWAALGYLIGGMAVWGFLGWLVDVWLHLGGIATAVGIVVGAAGGIVLIIRTFAVSDDREEDGGRHL